MAGTPTARAVDGKGEKQVNDTEYEITAVAS
jgi:hypothetical protein